MRERFKAHRRHDTQANVVGVGVEPVGAVPGEVWLGVLERRAECGEDLPGDVVDVSVPASPGGLTVAR
jgi:hypothetical protein